MKKIIIAIATAIGINLTSCANKGTQAGIEDNNKYLCGAYSDYRVLTDEDVQLFESAYTYKAKLTPQSVTSQVVAGTNFKFICTDESGNDVMVVVFKPLPNQGEAKVTSIETVSGQDTQDIVTAIVQNMYDDIMSMYYTGDEGQEYAFNKYASSKLNKLIADVNAAITKGEIESMVYGWGCDPWIMAQDWSHPVAEVQKVHDLSKNQCLVDVVIRDGENNEYLSNITITLVKEKKSWKVDDFASSETGIKTFTTTLTEDYEAAISNNNN